MFSMTIESEITWGCEKLKKSRRMACRMRKKGENNKGRERKRKREREGGRKRDRERKQGWNFLAFVRSLASLSFVFSFFFLAPLAQVVLLLAS